MPPVYSNSCALLLAAGIFISAAVSGGEPVPTAASEPVSIFIGATLIDGNGGAPLKNSVVVVTGNKITRVATAEAKDIAELLATPRANILRIDGKYLLPGFIDTNVHLNNTPDLLPVFVFDGIDAYLQAVPAVEGAQVALKNGVTTLVDTYGSLYPLMALRDRIASGEILGPRLLVAGTIIGWDGVGWGKISPLGKDYEKWVGQGTGSDLLRMYPDEVVAAIDKYMDLGPDLIKVGVTAHSRTESQSLMFSAGTLKAIVDSAHARNRIVEVHATSVEGERTSIEAGVDIITHSEMVYSQRLRPDFAQQICKSKTFFAIFAQWTQPKYVRARAAHFAGRSAPDADQAARAMAEISPHRRKTAGLPQDVASVLPVGHGAVNGMADDLIRDNAKILIRSGCKVVVGTDSSPTGYDQAVHGYKVHADMGTGTIDAIEGLVDLGMSPGEALRAATRTGAESLGLADRIGTVEVGKLADLVVLNADPLQEIDNIRKIDLVVRDGKVIRPGDLPITERFYRR